MYTKVFNMKNYIHKICLISALFFAFFIKSMAQTDTVFWFSAPEVNRYHSGGSDPVANYDNYGVPIYLHLTTFEYAANVSISMPANAAFFNGGNPINISIPANTTHREDLSNHFHELTVSEFNSMENKLKWTTSELAIAQPYINKGNKGIKISSDRYIAAYYEIGVRYNMDLISLKGNNALGKQFFVPLRLCASA